MKTLDLNKPASKHNPFVVPTGYFSQFTQQMMQRIKEQSAEQTYQPEMPIIRWLPWLGVASVAALIALFSFFNTPSSVNIQSASSGAETAQNKTSDNQSDMVYDYLMMANAADYTAYENDY